jgi:CheY-like chemotaxis protein
LCEKNALICDDDSFNVMALQFVLEELGLSVEAFDSG